MGAVTFSLDHRMVAAIRSALPLTTLCETGTFKGDTVAAFEGSFEKIISIELSPELHAEAAQRFAGNPKIRILNGNSATHLRALTPELATTSTLYWLDAHWCAANATAGQSSQCPLLDELKSIGTLNPQSIILIDDARLFLAPPLAPHEISQWPTFQEILTTLQQLSPEHAVMVLNDVIIFYPLIAKAALTHFAHHNGLNWLTAVHVMNEHLTLQTQIEKQELCISEQHKALSDYRIELQKKEAIIEDQQVTIKAYATAYRGLFILQLLMKLVRYTRIQSKRILILSKRLTQRLQLMPKLGQLKQYPPRPLQLKYPAIKTPSDASLKISLATPSFRQGAFIERTIKSVLDQHYPNLEYYVQDGGSTDETVAILKQYEHALTGWESVRDNGQSHAINLGLRKTTGDIMGWLNSDDMLLPGTLHIVAEFFRKNPTVDVLYGNRLMIDENDMEIGRWIMPGHNSTVLSWVDYVPQETMFWRRRIWEKTGGQIDESFQFAMDWDLIVRFRDAGAVFAHIPQFLGAFRVHSSQKTCADISDIGYQEMDRIRKRALGYVPTHAQIRKAVAPFLLKHVWTDLRHRITSGRRTP